MATYHFSKEDFNVFTIEGLEPRMEALIKTIRPKLEALGSHFSEFLSEHTGEEYYPHVAKHLRRKTNPPHDTWVAFATNKRGYKMLPHFQIGLFGSHVFVQYGVIYESPEKQMMADRWEQNIDKIMKLPDNFMMKKDHMKEDYTMMNELSKDDIIAAIHRLKNVKKGELLFGKVYYPDDAALLNDEVFIDEIEKTFLTLLSIQ